MLIIFPNEPLLFVHGPPVFIKVAITVEESTSVFISNEAEQIEQVKEEQEQEKEIEVQHNDVEVLTARNPAIQRKISYLNNSFRRLAYQPLQFVLEGETVTGSLEKVEEDTVWIQLTGEHQDILAVEMGNIEEVLWRGKPFEDIN